MVVPAHQNSGSCAVLLKRFRFVFCFAQTATSNQIDARVSLAVSISGVLTAALVGGSAGLVSAYFGGWSAAVLMRVADLLFSFPSFVLALFLMVVLGFGVTNIAASIALIYFPLFARLARNMALVVKE